MNLNEELQAVERAIEVIEEIGGYPPDPRYVNPRFVDYVLASAQSVGHLFTEKDRAVLEAAWAVMEAHGWTGPKWPPDGLKDARRWLSDGD